MEQIDRNLIKSFFAADGEKIYENILETLDKYSMKDLINSGVLVGLSGGADSVMLLCFLVEYRRRTAKDFSISAMHINHMIRGDEASRDEFFCINLCDALGIELFVERIDVPCFAAEKGLGLEEAARQVRYNAFQKIIQGRDNLGCVAVAHNLNDSAETVLFNIMRGCGTRGACGIRPVRDNIVRPLIKVAKSDIVFAMETFGIRYVVDSSNLSNDYTRNYIRNKILPVFANVCDNPEKMIGRFADNLREDDDYLEKEAIEFVSNNSVITNKALLELDPSIFARVLSLMVKEKGANLSSNIISDIHSNLANDSFSYSLIGGKFVCDRGECYISVNDNENIDYCVYINTGKSTIEELGLDIIVSNEKIQKSCLNVYNFSIQANLSSAIIKGRLYFRPKKDGDSIYYGGMTHKLKKLFNDRKFPLYDRRNYPVLCDDCGVVWAPGFGVRDDGVEAKKGNNIFILIGSSAPHRFLK